MKKYLILVRGLGGTGKTTLSTALAKALKFPVLNRDDVKEAIRDFGFDLKMQSDIGYKVMNTLAEVQLENGISVILDANARFNSMQNFYEALATKFGCLLWVVTCRCDDETEWRQRIQARGESHPVSFEETRSMSIEPFELERHIYIDSSSTNLSEAVELVLKAIKSD